MAASKKPSRNKLFEDKKKAQGLTKVTLWCPDHCTDDLKELMSTVVELYLAKGDDHKDVFPAMYRDVVTGVMGNKNVNELRKVKADKAKKNEY